MQTAQADADPGASDPPPASSTRGRLREATNAAHLRLHVHPAFAPLEAGTLDQAGYRTLLTRLFGFHYPLESVLRASPWARTLGLTALPPRAERLSEDLLHLGLPPASLANLPVL